MESIFNREHLRIFAFINPISGHSNPEQIRKQLDALCEKRGWEYQAYETTGEENLTEMVQQKVGEEGYDLIIAAGGDGTISQVVDGLVYTDVPLAIVPVGTGNGLARALKIPLKIEDAVQLLGEENRVRTIDAMSVGDRYFILSVSAGISSRSMGETKAEDKQATGILAYIRTITEDIIEAKPLKFWLEIDGRKMGVKAVEVYVANGQFLSDPLDFFGKAETLSDGLFEVNLVTADKPSEFVNLAWDLLTDPDKVDKDMHDLNVHEKIRIEVEGDPIAVQADGELIGETPVEIKVEREALKIVTKPSKEG